MMFGTGKEKWATGTNDAREREEKEGKEKERKKRKRKRKWDERERKEEESESDELARFLMERSVTIFFVDYEVDPNYDRNQHYSTIIFIINIIISIINSFLSLSFFLLLLSHYLPNFLGGISCTLHLLEENERKK